MGDVWKQIWVFRLFPDFPTERTQPGKFWVRQIRHCMQTQIIAYMNISIIIINEGICRSGVLNPRAVCGSPVCHVHFSSTYCVRPAWCLSYLQPLEKSMRFRLSGCEQHFSKKKNVKSCTRMCLTDGHLAECERISGTETKPDTESLQDYNSKLVTTLEVAVNFNKLNSFISLLAAIRRESIWPKA
jgi:hypothetical protein